MRHRRVGPVQPGRLFALVLGGLVVLAAPRPVRAQGFETVPGAVPASGLAIGNQYVESEGTTFTLSNSTLPILAQAGPPLEAFSGACGDDTVTAGANVGQFFLIDPRTPLPPNPIPAALIITYNAPVPCCRGVIIDIDQDEAWTIEAFDSSDAVVGTVVLDTATPGAGDCLATTWSFMHASADIAKVRISYSGNTQVNIGYAWDNFESARSQGFEKVPGGSPASGLTISNQYQWSDGMSLSLSNLTSPVLAQAGSPLEAFNSSFGDDGTSPLADAGQFFLIDPQTLLPASPAPADLIVTYNYPVSFSKGVIIDIDQDEAWAIEAINSFNAVIDTVVLDTSTPGAGDGLATPWSFSHGAADIAKVRIRYTGSTLTGVGYGWDNIASIPCPVMSPINPGLLGSNGVPVLTGLGTLIGGTSGSLFLADGNPSSPTFLSVALASVPVPFKGGVLAAYPFTLLIALVTDGNGTLLLPFTWPSGVPQGTNLFFQCAIQDAGAIHGVALSNALQAVTP